MKKNIDKPILKKDDYIAVNKRRENYARTRDLQALDSNEAIAKRQLTKEKNLVKCEICGKEFTADITSDDTQMICPDCK